MSHLNRLKEIEVPVVIFDKTIPQDYFEQIIFDNKQNVETAVEKLANNQCKNILAIFGDENLEMTQTRRDHFLEKLKNYPDINCKLIYCESAESVKEKLSIILDYENFDGYFAMSDETLAGLHSSLIKKKIDIGHINVIAISEGTFPKYLDESYELIINDGFRMGVLAATHLLNNIKKINSDTSEPSTFYV